MNTEDGLTEYLSGLFRGETTREWYDSHDHYLTEASPRTVNGAIDKLVAQTDDYDRLDESVAQFIRAASRGLDNYTILSPPDGHYLEILMRENRKLEELRDELKNSFKRNLKGVKDVPSGLSAVLQRLQGLISHFALEAIPGERFEAMKSDFNEYGTAFGVQSDIKGVENMSENIRNREERKEQLKDILGGLREDGDIHAMKKRFKSILQDLSPEELAEAEQALIREGVPVEEVQKLCEVHVAAFEDALQKSSRKEKSEKVLTGHPIDSYRKENRELKVLLRRLRRSLSSPDTARSVLDSISEVEKHYARKENQLFPFLEGVGFTGPSKVMWGKHDEIRLLLKELSALLSARDIRGIRKKGRELITATKRMIFMEEKILFPTALRKLPESTWKQIRRGESEIGYAWIKPGSLWDPDVIPGEQPSFDVAERAATDEGIELSVGRLLPFQIDLLLRNLPLDVTYVDENDRVRYYSQGKERIFPRSPGIIGRDVQNCHPPKSVHVVQKIVEDFRTRKRSEADFWIEMGGNFIYIRYFPLFEGEIYRGVLEVSQDLTPLRALTGEKRLLDEE